MNREILIEREKQHQKTLRRLAASVASDYCNETYNKVWEEYHLCKDCRIDKFVREYFPELVDKNGDVDCCAFQHYHPMELFRVLGFDGVIKEHYIPDLATLDKAELEETVEAVAIQTVEQSVKDYMHELEHKIINGDPEEANE